MSEGGSLPGAEATSTISVILAAFAPLAGKRILDIGCGAGVLAGSLSERGACVTGVDPNPEAVAAARRAVPAATFHQARAEALSLADDSFDGAVFLNSLHHVPEPAMQRALAEAARVVEPARPIVVIEPLAEGSFFSALRPVEDETKIRTAAQETLRRTLEGGMFELVSRADYLRRERFTDVDEFLTRIVAVDPTRATAAAERRPDIEAAFRCHARAAADGRITLEQPLRAHVLTASAPKHL
jgi:ubiquinone/menaquinone biosynthesis C-methylase UbiE